MSEEMSVSLTENRLQRLLRLGHAVPRFLQGVYPFIGRGVFDLGPLDAGLAYTVPPGCVTQVVYFRAGNMSDALVYFTLTLNGIPARYFPVGPQSDLHIPLAIVEDHPEGTRIEIGIAAPRGLAGTVVVDAGLVEMNG